ncbi:MAG TPA: M1 family metallopeptidase [Rubricoccaceae bacterium]|nr:M1 family metallopeptidase [Rubricoccaceae bacterium]
MPRLPHRLPALLALAALGLAAGCAAPGQAQGEQPAPAAGLAPLPEDVHSYARPDEARVTHVALDLDADFEQRVLSGTATLTIAAAPGADSVVLDTRDLTIEEVTDAAGNPLDTVTGPDDPILGRPLTVMLPDDGDRVVVHYRTSPEAAAVQWLGPAQTSSGQPFLFTQGQAILTRTWVPTQDSPGIRQTYEAEITVPEGLVAVMSAEGNAPEGTPTGDGRETFRFRLDTPVPPYLIALAVGDLAFRELGPRTGVWAEPQVVDAAAYEFADLEAMVDAAEALYGPYRWGRYDVLVLPPSFPFGGMENPRLTFATPTVLAGDRSLVSLVAHELAHSWSGNLVTNATWDDFWLNEGFTSYFENRIMEAVYGAEYAAMLEALSRAELAAELEELAPEDTHLHLDLRGRDPDEGMNAIAYDKGAAFLHTIEEVVGRERFDAFLRGYFDAHAFQPMTAERFLEYMDAELFAGDDALRARVDPEAWVYGPGLPPNAPAVHSEAFARVEAQAGAFAAGTAPADLATEDWTTHEWLHFLQSLPEALTDDQLAALDDAFGFNETGNSEVLFAWLRVAIRNEYDPAVPALERFLTTQGRRKFVLPLFTDLAASDWGRPIAERIYREARPGYHAITANSVDAVLGVPAGG